MKTETNNTPRTDKKAVSHIGFYTCATVPADFARDLEREIAKLNHQLLKTESDLMQSQDINSFLDTEFRIACKQKEKAEAEVARLMELLNRAIEICEHRDCTSSVSELQDEIQKLKTQTHYHHESYCRKCKEPK